MKTLMYLMLVAAVILTAAEPKKTEGYEVGDYARDFNLKGVDGKMVSLADYQEAGGFVVIFTCNTCPYAKMYEERIKALHQDYADQGFPVVAINPNCAERSPGDSMLKMKERADEKDFNFAYLQDETQEIAQTYGATNTPQVYLLKKTPDSRYQVAYKGAIDNNYKDPDKVDKYYVRNAIDALLANEDILEKNTKAIGCTIKWKM